MVSVVEAVLEAPRQILMAQQHAARGEAVAEMKADGIEYDERMPLLDEVTWPQPLAELLEATYEIYRQRHPWLPEDALSPKSVVREMYEQGMRLHRLRRPLPAGPLRGAGAALPHRRLPDAAPDRPRGAPHPELDDLIEWLGETVRQTDSSLLDEWEALTDPEAVRRAPRTWPSTPPPPPRPISAQERAFRVMVRNAMFRRVELVARDDLDGLMRLERAAADRTDPSREVAMTRSRWDQALEDYYAEHDTLGTAADARGPKLLLIEPRPGSRWGRRGHRARLWRVRQVLDDPEGHHDWVIDAVADLDASDEPGSSCSPPWRCTGSRGRRWATVGPPRAPPAPSGP